MPRQAPQLFQAFARIASASDYPKRPVHLIIGYPPGGSADMTARLTSQWLSERLGQQFIVAVARRAGERDQRRPIRAAQFRLHARYHPGGWDYSLS